MPTVFTNEPDAVLGLKTIPEELPVHLTAKPRRNFVEEEYTSPSDSSVSSSSAASVISADDEEDTSISSLSETEEYPSAEKLQAQSTIRPIEAPLTRRLSPFVSLVMRLYEAHLLMGHMMLLVTLRVATSTTKQLLAKPTFTVALPSLALYEDPTEFVAWAYNLTDKMRTLSLLFSIIMFLFYDRYHQQAVKGRWQVPGNRLGVQSSDRSERKFPVCMLDYFALPAGIVYGVIPILHAQFMHLFTDRLVYTVSFKPKGMEQRRADPEKGVMV